MIELYMPRRGEGVRTTQTLQLKKRSRHGVGDKPMSCKPEVADLIPGLAIKPFLGELWVFQS